MAKPLSIDFSRLGGGKNADNVIHPKEIFGLLPRKSRAYQYLRDVQAEVLGGWFDRRTEKDLVLKMNTGSGKTLVALLILKSSANEGVGTAVYVVPDNYLAKQVASEAEQLGLNVTDDVNDVSFLRGRSILIVNIYKLINGLSVFGVGQTGVKIPIGSLVVDDVHACLSSTEAQFTLKISAPSDLYYSLQGLFESDLKQQSETGFLDIKDAIPDKNMLVPFWAWSTKVEKAAGLIHKSRDEEGIKWVWPLIKEDLRFCNCVFGDGEIEISPKCLPIDVIPSFIEAKRRIFMSATISDDSVLLTHFDIDENSVGKPLVPSTASDIGERMILIPQELNPRISTVELKVFLKEQSTNHNVVVIVPSGNRAEFWADSANMILTSANMYEGIGELKQGHVGLVILVNRYDGIDLPYEACRILVIDGLPDVRRKIDKVEQNILAGSEYLVTRMIHRIEQGMGRGVRASDDYCIVFLIGHSLTRILFTSGAMGRFSPATRAQLDLSGKLAEQVRNMTLDQFQTVMSYSLDRDPGWISATRSALADLRYNPEGSISAVAFGRRKAFNQARVGDYSGAVATIQGLVQEIEEQRLRGWLLQLLAEYTQFTDAAKAQVVQQSAIKENALVVRPIQGISYSRLDVAKADQAKRLGQFVKVHFHNLNKFIIDVHALVEDLLFAPDTSEPFEEATKRIGTFLGFGGQRPEKEYGKGPDVLWALGGGRYVAIECKNGATTPEISKHDCNQLSGSMNWFRATYDPSCSAVPLMIHPVEQFNRSGSPGPGTRIMTKGKLEEFRTALRALATSIAGIGNMDNHADIARALVANGLTGDSFIERFTVAPKITR